MRILTVMIYMSKTVGNKGLDPDADTAGKTGFVQNIRNKGSLTGSETGKCQTRGNPQKANKGQRQENPKPPQETLGALEKAVTKNRHTENDELSRITGKDRLKYIRKERLTRLR